MLMLSYPGYELWRTVRQRPAASVLTARSRCSVGYSATTAPPVHKSRGVGVVRSGRCIRCCFTVLALFWS